MKLHPQTYDFGKSFEHWIIAECFRLNEFKKLDYTFSYLRTKDDAEIDLIVERHGMPVLIVEIKLAELVFDKHVRSLNIFYNDWDHKAEAQI